MIEWQSDWRILFRCFCQIQWYPCWTNYQGCCDEICADEFTFPVVFVAANPQRVLLRQPDRMQGPIVHQQMSSGMPSVNNLTEGPWNMPQRKKAHLDLSPWVPMSEISGFGGWNWPSPSDLFGWYWLGADCPITTHLTSEFPSKAHALQYFLDRHSAHVGRVDVHGRCLLNIVETKQWDIGEGLFVCLFFSAFACLLRLLDTIDFLAELHIVQRWFSMALGNILKFLEQSRNMARSFVRCWPCEFHAT